MLYNSIRSSGGLPRLDPIKDQCLVLPARCDFFLLRQTLDDVVVDVVVRLSFTSLVEKSGKLNTAKTTCRRAVPLSTLKSQFAVILSRHCNRFSVTQL